MIKKILKNLITILLLIYLGGMIVSAISSGAVMFIALLFVALGYAASMLFSIKCSRKLLMLKEKVMLDMGYELKKGDRPLFYAIFSNLPFYFIYFVFSLLPIDIPGYWFIAGVPCCVISALRPINMHYQSYNFITNKSRAYWLIQLALAIFIWALGRTIVLLIFDQ